VKSEEIQEIAHAIEGKSFLLFYIVVWNCSHLYKNTNEAELKGIKLQY
jgi:hypothetical protein